MSDFVTTHWSLVLNAGHGSEETARKALEQLCQIYRYPIYAYSCQLLKDSHEDAEDLTQGFFVELLNKNLFAKARPEKGMFRSFLLTSFRLYRAKQRERMGAQKRGGSATVLSLDAMDADEWPADELPDGRLTPDQAFERNWAVTVLDQAHTRLAADYAKRGKEQVFARLRELLQAPDESPGYATIAAELGKTKAAIKMEVSRMRAQYGNWLRAVVADTVSDPAEVDGELRYLLKVLSG